MERKLVITFTRLSPARRTLPWLLLVVLITSCARERGVRVVLVTLDTLRWDSFAGAPDAPAAMPHLAEWASDATVFERFHAASSSTQPSHASMLTGLQPWAHGVHRNGMRLEAVRRTVPEILGEAGFETAAVVASMPLASVFGFDQGFARYVDAFDLGDLESPYWRQAAARAADAEGEVAPSADEPFYSLAEATVERAFAELDAMTSRRQFLWLHLFDPHSPYGDAVEGELRSHPGRILQLVERGEDPAAAIAEARRLYDADVASMDAVLARWLERLARQEDVYETHVVIVSDHGESFGEDGSMAHSRRLTPEQIHVPLLLHSPRLAPGTRSDVAGCVDLAPTLLALAGVEADLPGGRDLTSRGGVRPHAFGMRRPFDRPTPDRRIDGSEQLLPEHWFFWVDESGRLVRGNRDFLVPPPGGEEIPAAEAARARMLFAAFEDELEAAQAGGEIENPEVLEALRALGYVD